MSDECEHKRWLVPAKGPDWELAMCVTCGITLLRADDGTTAVAGRA